jgi:hypothetical protein
MEDMITDMITKPLANDRHQVLTKEMGLEAFDYHTTKAGSAKNNSPKKCQKNEIYQVFCQNQQK